MHPRVFSAAAEAAALRRSLVTFDTRTERAAAALESQEPSSDCIDVLEDSRCVTTEKRREKEDVRR